MASMASTGNCIICSEDIASSGGGRIVGKKGLQKLIEVSSAREDGLHGNWHPEDQLPIHDKCYKSYTAPKNIAKAKKIHHQEGRDSPVPSLRSCVKPYDYQTHCLICAEEFDFERYQRHPERYSTISNVEFVNKEKKSLIQESLLEVCEKRQDLQAINVKARILFAGDLRAVESKYHRACMQAFMSNKNIASSSTFPKRNIRNLNELNDSAFKELCDWIITQQRNQNCQFTLKDLREKLATYLPQDVPAYTTAHMKRRLQETFGDEVTIAEIQGKTNIVVLKKRAVEILCDSYMTSEVPFEEHNEAVRLAKLVGSMIRKEIKAVDCPTDVYPVPGDVDLIKLKADMPESLQNLVQALFDDSKSDSAKMKKELLQTSLCHVIMQAAGKQSYISPLMMSVGLFIHQTTRSRVILDVLSSLGLCVSYDQVMAFERAAAVTHTIHDLAPGLVSKEGGGGFCQWVADNFDYNEDTVSGHNTTHVMGIIACQQTSKKDAIHTSSIQRQSISAAEVAEAGDFGEIIRPYRPPSKSLMADVRIRAVQPVNLHVSQFEHLDTLWLYSSLLSPNPPNWQGFMSTCVKGQIVCTNVVYNPMVPLNPDTNEAVLSTMEFVISQAKKAGICCATLTFDQPLYYRAYKIKIDNQPEFQKLFLRLGGFHQLMSFLGAECKLMEGSRLEQLWETVYATKSLPKMMEGKAYTKTLRACILTDAALHLVLMQGGDGDQTYSEPEDTLGSFLDQDPDAYPVSVEGNNNIDQNQSFSSGEDSPTCSACDANEEVTFWGSLRQLYQSVSSNEISIDDVDQNKFLR